MKGGIRLPSVAIKEYSPLVAGMKTELGDRSYPIWLIVNPKFPNVIQDIWNPILSDIQDRVYRRLHARINTKNIFIKNVVSDIGLVSKVANCQATEVANETFMLRDSILEHQPKILITFGTLTDEFVRRVLGMRPEKGPGYWNTTNLGEEFERSIANFDINQTNRIPLLRRVMKSGKLIEECDDFSWEDSETYFRDVGTKIADRIIENKDSLKIWI